MLRRIPLYAQIFIISAHFIADVGPRVQKGCEGVREVAGGHDRPRRGGRRRGLLASHEGLGEGRQHAHETEGLVPVRVHIAHAEPERGARLVLSRAVHPRDPAVGEDRAGEPAEVRRAAGEADPTGADREGREGGRRQLLLLGRRGGKTACCQDVVKDGAKEAYVLQPTTLGVSEENQ